MNGSPIRHIWALNRPYFNLHLRQLNIELFVGALTLGY
jgi:hypothetical protein